ncbi:MAG: TlpA disulfide reductase family protein, partial [Bacteroidota bacterium]
GRSKARAKDSIRIDFPVYDSYMVGLFEQGLIEGKWVVNYKENYEIPFIARYGENHRFTTVPKPTTIDLTGTWEVLFEDENSSYPGIGEFKQEGNQVTGTFRTETGDYRFLEGQISDRKLYMSVFDGSHAFLFEAQIEADGDEMVGFFRSGTHYRSIWTAKRNAAAQLTSPNELTQATAADQRFNFSFLDTNGDSIRLTDAAFDDKVKLVQIMGTWCPNCRDETTFLVDYLKNNSHPDLAVIGIGFERYRQEERALAALKRYQDQLDIPYPLLWGGYYNKSEATAALTGLDKVISYPTLLFIDRNNRIRKIHTGFNGPATSKFAAFQEEFKTTLATLLAEGK